MPRLFSPSPRVVTWFHIDLVATRTILAPACLRTQLRLDEHAGTFRPVLRAVALFCHPPANTQIIFKGLMTSPITFFATHRLAPGGPTRPSSPYPSNRTPSSSFEEHLLHPLVLYSDFLVFRTTWTFCSAITPEHLVLPRNYFYFVLYPRAVDPFIHPMLISCAARRSLVFILVRGRTVCPSLRTANIMTPEDSCIGA